MNRIHPVRLSVVAGACLLASGITALDAQPMSLKAEITSPSSNQYVDIRIPVRGIACNMTPQDPFINGGLQAFYSGPYPDIPQSGELPFGSNSEFATNAWNSDNWWIMNNASFRSAYGLPGDGGVDGHWLPPLRARKLFGQAAISGDDDAGWLDNFSALMEGRITIPSNGTYTLNGTADDYLRVYVDGQIIFDNFAASVFNGQVTLTAGEHPIAIYFGEFSGLQYYVMNMPIGATLKANPQFQHVFGNWTLDYGAWYATQRTGMLTMAFQNGNGGGSPIGETNYWKHFSSDNYFSDRDLAPQHDNYRQLMVGYWNVPQDGVYDFQGGADDRWAIAVSNNPAENPWTIPLLASDNSPVSGVSLTQGWKPIRIEFGEGGGLANWYVQWRVNGGSWDYFRPAALKSTADLAHDWISVTNCPNSFATDSSLVTVSLPDELDGRAVELRLRTYGSDITSVETIMPVTVRKVKGSVYIVR